MRRPAALTGGVRSEVPVRVEPNLMSRARRLTVRDAIQGYLRAEFYPRDDPERDGCRFATRSRGTSTEMHRLSTAR